MHKEEEHSVRYMNCAEGENPNCFMG